MGVRGPAREHVAARRPVLLELGATFPYGSQQVAQGRGDIVLEVPVALVAGRDVLWRSSGRGGQQVQQVGQTRLGLPVVAHLAVGVGDRLAHLLGDLLVRVEEPDRPERGVGRLGHLALGVLQVHDAGSRSRNGSVGDHEGLPVAVIEPDGHVAGELQMLALVVAHRDGRGVVEEDVGRHQCGVGEERDACRLLSLSLVLELRHPPQLAHGDRALQQPGQSGVLGDVALDEEGATVGIEPDGQQVQGRIERVGAQVGRLDLRGEGMEVDHAVEGVVAVLEGNPVPEGPEVVPQREVAGRRNAGEDPVHGAPW